MSTQLKRVATFFSTSLLGIAGLFAGCQGDPDALVKQLKFATVTDGESVTLSVETISPYPTTYQWTNGNPIPGATATTYTTPALRYDAIGSYRIKTSGQRECYCAFRERAQYLLVHRHQLGLELVGQGNELAVIGRAFAVPHQLKHCVRIDLKL